MKFRIDLIGVGLSLATLAVIACSSDPEPVVDAGCGNDLESFRFEHGSVDGHADPYGAKAAKQARAGRVRDSSQIVQGPNAQYRPREGDFILANDKIALYIEKEGRETGYATFGGEIIGIEPVGDDGRPLGISAYRETLLLFSRQTVKPDKVTVINDGSDGKAAIVRASGVLANIDFMDTFKVLAQEEYGFPAAFDYVLEPGAEKVLVRFSFANTRLEAVDFSALMGFGFFHSSRMLRFGENVGYSGKGDLPWLAYDSGDSGFVVRSLVSRMPSDLEVSGFQLYRTKNIGADACATKTVDYFDIVAGRNGIDGTLEAKRRAYGEPAGREIRGTVKETNGVGMPSVVVHAQTPDGKYLTRVTTDEAGAFTLHVPAGTVTLTPTRKGWAIPQPTAVPDGAPSIDLTLPQRATIIVNAKESATNEPLPVRVQVIPQAGVVTAPEAFGLREEVEGRIWQDFAINGQAILAVPPGTHRVVVSHGYEYELSDTTVTAEVGKTVNVPVSLARSVDSTGIMCADFHIHSAFSADSDDNVDEKVKGAIVDGLDIPVSSEHEWIIDFQPIIERLGLKKWAFGMPSEELTTFSWGHFGVVPIYPRPDLPNNGAISWIGKLPPDIFKQVNGLPEKPVLIVNHPNGAGFFGYFTSAALNRQTGKGDLTELWSEDFGAVEIATGRDFAESRNGAVADWLSLLDAGKTFWGVGSSDTHDHRTKFTGYPRTCLRIGHDDPLLLTPGVVRDALRSGNAVISGGPMMTVTGPNGIPPGGTSTPGEYTVSIQTPSWFGADALEVIIDGVTTETKALTPLAGAGPGKRYEAKVNVQATTSKPRHYVVFHATGPGDLSPLHPKDKPFAVSNPIFF